MNFEIGKLYKVKSDHAFHANRIGKFEFIGGPEANCAIFSEKEVSTKSHIHKTMFATGLDDVVEIE